MKSFRSTRYLDNIHSFLIKKINKPYITNLSCLLYSRNYLYVIVFSNISMISFQREWLYKPPTFRILYDLLLDFVDYRLILPVPEDLAFLSIPQRYRSLFFLITMHFKRVTYRNCLYDQMFYFLCYEQQIAIAKMRISQKLKTQKLSSVLRLRYNNIYYLWHPSFTWVTR